MTNVLENAAETVQQIASVFQFTWGRLATGFALYY